MPSHHFCQNCSSTSAKESAAAANIPRLEIFMASRKTTTLWSIWAASAALWRSWCWTRMAECRPVTGLFFFSCLGAEAAARHLFHCDSWACGNANQSNCKSWWSLRANCKPVCLDPVDMGIPTYMKAESTCDMWTCGMLTSKQSRMIVILAANCKPVSLVPGDMGRPPHMNAEPTWRVDMLKLKSKQSQMIVIPTWKLPACVPGPCWHGKSDLHDSWINTTCGHAECKHWSNREW